jgi:hypothetical protein
MGLRLDASAATGVEAIVSLTRESMKDGRSEKLYYPQFCNSRAGHAEVTDEVMDHANSVVVAQAANKMANEIWPSSPKMTNFPLPKLALHKKRKDAGASFLSTESSCRRRAGL